MKRIFALAVMVAMLFSLAACGAKSPATGGTKWDPNAKVTVRWLTNEDPKNFNWDPIYEAFRKKHPNIEVEYIRIPAFGEMHDKGKAMMAADDAPDIIRIDDDFVAGYAVRGLLLPLDDLFQKHNFDTTGYHKDFRGWPRVDGKQYAFIFAMHARALYVNEDMFKAAGVPLPSTKWEDPSWNWDTALETAKKLTKGDTWGISILNDNGYEETWSRNNGGQGTYSRDGRKFELASPEAIESFQWLSDLIHVHKVHPPYSLYSQQPAQDLFAAGRVAMFMGTNGNMNSLRRKIGDKFQWTVRPVPMKKNGVAEGSLNTYAIPKNAKNPDAAFLLLKFLAEEPAQKLMTQTNWALPVHPDWVKYFLRPDQQPSNQEVFIEGWKNYFYPVSMTVNDELVTNLYRRPMQKAWAGEAKIADIMGAAKAEADKLLAEFPNAKFQ